MARLCESAGVKPLHAETLLAHVFRHHIRDVRTIPELPQSFYGWLERHTQTLDVKLIKQQKSADGTRKLLLAMPDGFQVETVLIPEKERLTQCISTQVGCALNCSFCLTATAGLARNLNAAEMVAQIMSAATFSNGQAHNLVLMGMGEPMHNYQEVARFVRIATDAKGMAFAPRHVTVSTAGHVPGIRRMIADRLPCNLALSLNATTDAVRSRIMPVNKRWPIAEVLYWAGKFAQSMHRRILIEYVMLSGINDADTDAKRLVQLLADLPCTINLLPFNEFDGNPYQRPNDARISDFRHILTDASKVAVVRKSRGMDISAACGQLFTLTKHPPQGIRQTA